MQVKKRKKRNQNTQTRRVAKEEEEEAGTRLSGHRPPFQSRPSFPCLPLPVSYNADDPASSKEDGADDDSENVQRDADSMIVVSVLRSVDVHGEHTCRKKKEGGNVVSSGELDEEGRYKRDLPEMNCIGRIPIVTVERERMALSVTPRVTARETRS